MAKSEPFAQPPWLDELMAIERSRRERAFQTMMSEWHRPIYEFLRSMLGSHEDAADATQETFIQVMHSVSDFRREAQFSTWLYAIGRRKALDALRKRQRAYRFEDPSDIEQVKSELMADPFFDGNSAEAQLHAAVLCLPKRQQEIFVLRYFEALPFAELATIIGISEGAAKASYFHAKTKITRYVAAHLNA